MKRKTIKKHRRVLIEYIKVKIKAKDWHGVSDAANDLREIEIQLKHKPTHKQRKLK